MLWGVFTEKKRGALRLEPPAGALHPSRAGRATTDWLVIEAAEGATPEVADRARFLASAWLASRGIDMASVRPEDLRTEVTTSGDGASTTRVLVRATALHGSRRHH
jgi:hypothetical protein